MLARVQITYAIKSPFFIKRALKKQSIESLNRVELPLAVPIDIEATHIQDQLLLASKINIIR
jgi:hypothetical protein